MAGWYLGLRATRDQILYKKEKINAYNIGFLDNRIGPRVLVLHIAHRLGLKST